jgi:hypothetical protein
VNIVEEYDRRSLYPMVLKCYHYLHPMAKSEVECANHIEDTKFDLNIFKQTPTTSESTTKLVTKEMLRFRCYQVDSKEIKCLLEWRAKHETMFITVDFLAQEILRIVGLRLKGFFFFSKDIYKLEEISITIKKIREIDICEQKLAK